MVRLQQLLCTVPLEVLVDPPVGKFWANKENAPLRQSMFFGGGGSMKGFRCRVEGL